MQYPSKVVPNALFTFWDVDVDLPIHIYVPEYHELLGEHDEDDPRHLNRPPPLHENRLQSNDHPPPTVPFSQKKIKYFSVRENTGALGEAKETLRRNILSRDEAERKGYTVDPSKELGDRAKYKDDKEDGKEDGKEDDKEDGKEDDKVDDKVDGEAYVEVEDYGSTEVLATSYSYTTEKDNETPGTIAAKYEMTVKDFIRINIKEHPKLKSTSQFYPNTKVQVFKKCIPEDESAEATKQKENPLKRKKPDDDSLRENTLNKREAILKEKEKAVKEKEKDVKEKEKALEIRERILENKEKILKNDLHIVKRERDIVDTQTKTFEIMQKSLSHDLGSMKSSIESLRSRAESALTHVAELQEYKLAI